MSKRFTLAKALAVSSISLISISLLATQITNGNVDAINTYLKTSNWEYVTEDNGQDTEYFKSDYKNLNDLIADSDETIETIVEEGAILLKNENNALPLTSDEKNVTLFGKKSVSGAVTSTGSVFTSGGCGREVTLKEGLENAGFNVNQNMFDYYSGLDYDSDTSPYKDGRNGMGTPGPLISAINEVPWSDVSSDMTRFRTGDVAIFNVSRISGEGNKDVNRSGCEDTPQGDALQLSNDERDVLKGLKALKDQGQIKKIIVLLNCTATIELDFLFDDNYGVDACMQLQAVGTTGFNAVGRLLNGTINPSGKLSDTLWYDNDQNPTLANQAGYEFLNPNNLTLHTATGDPTSGGYEQYYVVYQEGVYLGYKYTETRYEDYVLNQGNPGTFEYDKAVAYPFGYGNSYTTFEYSNFTVNKVEGKDQYEVSVTVQNTGDKAGKEAVEVYLQKPYDEYNKTNKVAAPSVELVGFDKTEKLEPNATETVTITVDGKYFASYDAEGAGTYVLTPGNYYLAVGNGAHEAVNNILASKGQTSDNNTRIDGAGDASLAAVALGQTALDSETYKRSITGKEVKNLFDDSDLNKYSETKDTSPVTYISRDDWNGTLVFDNAAHDTYTKITMTEKMLQDFRASWEETALEKDDVEYPTYGADNDITLVQMKDVPYEDKKWDDFMDQLTWDDTVNLLSNGMRMTAPIVSVGKPQTVDHNGPLGVTEVYTKGQPENAGESGKLKPSTFPTNGTLAGTMNPDLIEKVGIMHGENALWAGYSGFYAPGMNIHRSQYSSRNNEYYSEDGFLTGRVAAISINGTQSKGIYCYIKHFVLNDQETHRYGLSTWLNEQSFREIYLRPFQITIEEADAHAMMSSYNRVGTSVTGGKANLLTDWLRGEEGFDGFVVTDMYQLVSYYGLTFYLGLLRMPYGVSVGNDLVDGSQVNSQFDKYKTGYGELAWSMRESAKRILYTVSNSAAMNGWNETTQINYVLTWWQKTLVALDVIFGVAAVGSIVFFGIEYYKRNIRKKEEEEVQGE